MITEYVEEKVIFKERLILKIHNLLYAVLRTLPELKKDYYDLRRFQNKSFQDSKDKLIVKTDKAITTGTDFVNILNIKLSQIKKTPNSYSSSQLRKLIKILEPRVNEHLKTYKKIKKELAWTIKK